MKRLSTAQYLIKCAIQQKEKILTLSDCEDFICIITPQHLYKVDINGNTETEIL